MGTGVQYHGSQGKFVLALLGICNARKTEMRVQYFNIMSDCSDSKNNRSFIKWSRDVGKVVFFP